MINEYLDVNGRKIPQDKTPLPAFEGQRKTSGGELAAHYVRCELPRVCGLLWIGHCLKCKFYAGTYTRGIACRYNGKGAENYVFDGIKCANKKKMQKK